MLQSDVSECMPNDGTANLSRAWVVRGVVLSLIASLLDFVGRLLISSNCFRDDTICYTPRSGF